MPSRRTAGWFQSKRRCQRNPRLRSEGQSASVIAATPSVVPAARTVFSANVMLSTEVVPLPTSSAYTPNVAITVRLLRIGANIGAANFRSAWSKPVATAPTP